MTISICVGILYDTCRDVLTDYINICKDDLTDNFNMHRNVLNDYINMCREPYDMCRDVLTDYMNTCRDVLTDYVNTCRDVQYRDRVLRPTRDVVRAARQVVGPLLPSTCGQAQTRRVVWRNVLVIFLL